MSNPDQPSPEPDLQRFVDSLTPQRVMLPQIIIAALVSGVLMLLAVAFFLGMSKESQPLIAEGQEFLLAVTAAITLGSIALFFVLSKATVAINGATRINGNPVFNDTPEDQAFAKIQTMYIMRFAPLEGAAMAGIVFYFIGFGTLHLAALVPFLVLAYMAFPTRKRMIETFILTIKKDPRLLNTVR